MSSLLHPLSPQQWALGLAVSLPEDVQVKFEEWYNSVEIEAKASVDPYSEVLNQGSPAASLPADPVSSTPFAATSTGYVRLPCGRGSFPLPACRAVCHGGSDQQESGATTGSRTDRECRRQAIVGCRRSSGSPSPRSARVTAGPAEHDSELCTMADFSRRVPLDELRGRGPPKGLQPEVLEQISRWPSAHCGGEARTQLIAHTDGSACMTRAWPRLAEERMGSRYHCRGRVRSMEIGWRHLGASRDVSCCSVVLGCFASDQPSR